VIPTIPLPSGHAIPALGLGTWQLRGAECERAVRSALDLGYRHFDTAARYANETEVGTALNSSKIPRADLFVTTKVWPDHFRAADLKRSADESLKRLNLAYVDLLLLHWPNESVPLAETIGALNEVAAAGKTQSIGVSNFSIDLMQQAAGLSERPISNNQVKFHIQEPQTALHEHARRHGVSITAYSPLAKGNLAEHPVLTRIGAKHGKSASQVALRWLVQQDGVVVIPKATREPNLRSNLGIFDFTLDEADLRALNQLA
jgi:diketogulonate reductase-like aldo/keto reductase